MDFRRTIGASLALLCAANAAYAWEPEIGAMPRALTKVEYVDGTKVDFSALLGNPVVLYFGADWCESCTRWGRPAVQAAARKYKAKGLQIVFVDMDDNKLRQAKIRESKLFDMPIAMAKLELCPPGDCPDGLRDQGAFGRVYVYPSAIVLDSSGIVRARFQGGRGVADGLNAALPALMSGAQGARTPSAKTSDADASAIASTMDAQSVLADLGGKLVRDWLVTVEGVERTRTLEIRGVTEMTADTFGLVAAYGWSDQKKKRASVKAEISQAAEGRKLTLITPANSQIYATQSADGNFSGTLVYANGKSKPVKLVKMPES